MKTQKDIMLLFILMSFLMMGKNGQAGNPIKEGDQLLEEGHLLQAADTYYQAYLQDPTHKKADLLLFKTGIVLDLAAPKLYEDADRKCYLDKKTEEANPQCFDDYARRLNNRYGDNAFFYWADRIVIQYAGSHFQKILDDFPKSPLYADAVFKMFRGKSLMQGNPEEITDRVQQWIDNNSKSKILPEAWLLLGRLYADSWWVYARHAFVARGGVAQIGGIPENAEISKGKGLAAFRKVFEKYPDSAEAPVAKKEFQLLKNNKNDGFMYGISY